MGLTIRCPTSPSSTVCVSPRSTSMTSCFCPGNSSFMGKSMPHPKPYDGKPMVTCGPPKKMKKCRLLSPKNMGYSPLNIEVMGSKGNKSLSSGGRLTSHHFAACVCVSQVLCRLQECFHVAVSEAVV